MTNIRIVAPVATLILTLVGSTTSAKSGASAREFAVDPALRAGYEAHFRLSSAEVATYLAGLHLGTLPASGRYIAYEPGRNGGEIAVKLQLAKGEPMYFDGTGMPVMMAKSGFPVEVDVALEVEASSHPAAPAGANAVGLPATMTNRVLLDGGSNNAWLLAVPVAIPILGMTDSFGGDVKVHTQLVPEPSTLAAVGLGVFGFAVRRRSRR